jgi:anti-sigma factor RsiW
MSQNQEIIEARLCAYIDDELDASGRAELEKHLAANPQHQRLIEELRRTSALIHNLPHESAPPELAEAFHAHLERSVLLEGVSDDVAAADLKAPRWPQLVAMAAITLLTIGLGIVVYFALPGTGVRPQFVQSSQRPAALAGPAMEDDQSSDAKIRELDKSGSQQAQKPGPSKDDNPPMALGGSVPVGAVSNGVAASSADHLLTPRAATPPSEEASAVSTGATASAPVVLVMHSDDPAEARRSLVLYLVQQNIAWEPTQTTVAGKPSGGRDADTIPRFAEEPSLARQPAPSDQLATSQPAVEGIADAAKAAPADVPAAPAVAAAPASPSAPSGNVGRDLSPKQLSLGVASTQPAAQEMKQLQRAAEDAAPASPVVEIPRPEFAVSCKMTPGQADALRASLAQPGTVIDPLPVDVASKTPLETGEKQAATTQPANAPDFSLAGAAPAVPPTTNPIAAAAEPAPAAVGETDRATNFVPASTQPAVAPSATSAFTGAIQPASPGTFLDLVIVVRPTDHPTTQPAVVAEPKSPTTAPATVAAPATQP